MPSSKIGVDDQSDDSNQSTAEIKLTREDLDLLKQPTAPFVDDTTLYEPRYYDRETRLEYWINIMLQAGSVRPQPRGFSSWVRRENAAVSDLENYSTRHIQLFQFLTSQRWDQWYLNLLELFIILVIFGDNRYSHSVPKTAQYVPLILMIVTQLIPLFGTVYLMYRCYDLMHVMASKSFGKWAFSSVIIAQYIERFYLRGQDRSYIAGTCRNKNADIASRSSSVVGDGFKFIDSLESKSDNDLDLKSSSSMIVSNINMISMKNDNVNNELSNKLYTNVSSKLSNKISNSNEGISVDDEENENDDNIESNEIEMLSWKCVTCGTDNRAPRHPNYQPDILFGSVGEYYTRKFAIIKPRRDMPTCKKCYTDADYKPTIASSHLFIHYPDRYQAFSNYPIKTTVQPGLKRNKIYKYYNHIKSFLFGLRDDFDSLLIFNDWRLRKYLPSKFLEIHRQYKKSDEIYEVGEYIECQIQKLEWTRGIIIVSRKNHIYDIKYDSGDILRYVSEKSLRSLPEKQIFSYRVELSMLLLVITLPCTIALGIAVKPGYILINTLVVSAVLLINRVVMFVRYFYLYSAVGLYDICKLSLCLSTPLILLLISSLVCLLYAGKLLYSDIFYIFAAAVISSLPVLYMMKPTYIYIAVALYSQFLIGGYLLMIYLDSNNGYFSKIHLELGYCFIPIITGVITLKFLRYYLHTVWDVTLTIRPPKSFYK